MYTDKRFRGKICQMWKLTVFKLVHKLSNITWVVFFRVVQLSFPTFYWIHRPFVVRVYPLNTPSWLTFKIYSDAALSISLPCSRKFCSKNVLGIAQDDQSRISLVFAICLYSLLDGYSPGENENRWAVDNRIQLFKSRTERIVFSHFSICSVIPPFLPSPSYPLPLFLTPFFPAPILPSFSPLFRY